MITTQTQTLSSLDFPSTHPFLTLGSLSPHSTITNLHNFVFLSYSFLLMSAWRLSKSYIYFLLYVEIKCQLDATEVFIASSWHFISTY